MPVVSYIVSATTLNRFGSLLPSPSLSTCFALHDEAFDVVDRQMARERYVAGRRCLVYAQLHWLYRHQGQRSSGRILPSEPMPQRLPRLLRQKVYVLFYNPRTRLGSLLPPTRGRAQFVFHSGWTIDVGSGGGDFFIQGCQCE